MEQRIIKVKCPHCGAILSIRQVDIIGKNNPTIKCTICETGSPLREYKTVATRQEDRTQYPGNEKNIHYHEEGRTQISQGLDFTIGRLRVLPSGPIFQLRIGRHIVGRKSTNPPHADFGIPTESRRMSREHLIIDVKKVPEKGIVHYVSLCKQKVNVTYIGQTQLEYGDRLVLNHGDIIRLPDVDLMFEILNGEETEI